MGLVPAMELVELLAIDNKHRQPRGIEKHNKNEHFTLFESQE